jgi:hypothetical protein
MAEYGLWNPTITQQFIEPLVDNLVAVLQAGEAAVHTEVNNNEPMVAYQAWNISRTVNTNFPACSVIARRTRTNKGEGGPSVDEGHIVEILIEDIGPESNGLARSVMRRVRAAHIIIERAPLADLFSGYLPSNSQRPHWDIEHDYRDFFNAQKSTYKQNGSLIITFTGLMEKT